MIPDYQSQLHDVSSRWMALSSICCMLWIFHMTTFVSSSYLIVTTKTIDNHLIALLLAITVTLNEHHGISNHWQLDSFFNSMFRTFENWFSRARRFPLPDGPGQIKGPVGQMDLDRFLFFISYKQIEEFKDSWSQASDDFEKRQALVQSCKQLCLLCPPDHWDLPGTALLNGFQSSQGAFKITG